MENRSVYSFFNWKRFQGQSFIFKNSLFFFDVESDKMPNFKFFFLDSNCLYLFHKNSKYSWFDQSETERNNLFFTNYTISSDSKAFLQELQRVYIEITLSKSNSEFTTLYWLNPS